MGWDGGGEGASPRRDEWRGESGNQPREESREGKRKRFTWVAGWGQLEGDRGRKIPKTGKTQKHKPTNTPHTELKEPLRQGMECEHNEA